MLVGTLGALALGITARLWMRLIAPEPNFTWSGTIFIVAGFTVFGLAQSVAALARRRRWHRWPMRLARVSGVVGMLPLFMAAGGLMMPTVVGGGLAAWRTDWHPAVRSAVALLAISDVVLVSRGIASDFGLSARTCSGIAAMVLVYAVIVWATRATLAPAVRGSAGGEQGVGPANW